MILELDGMQPTPHEVGKPQTLPTSGESARPEDESTPLPGGSDSSEHAWEALGSTRVIEGNTPPSLPRNSLQHTETETETVRREIMPRMGREPVDFADFQLIRKIGEGAM